LIEEAKNIHKNRDFLEIDMLDLYKIDKKYDFIFFIASYHHLENISDREKVLSYTKNLLNPGGILFMTNWALNSELNYEKYQKSIIE
jgi:SAM-dependent methyltransferase